MSGVYERARTGDGGLVGTDCIRIIGGSGAKELACQDNVSYNEKNSRKR